MSHSSWYLSVLSDAEFEALMDLMDFIVDIETHIDADFDIDA